MKVQIVGGGPAGLYSAILLQKADPNAEIRVVERNAPDATFGWGVVFSEETLGALRDADYETYLDITDTFARWDRIDIRYRGELLSSRGHSFSAIARKRLLGILQRRCGLLGVELEFGVELNELPGDADLVVAADGVNSTVRRQLAAELGAKVEPEGCKYVWFGTERVFDAFTFSFRESEWGLIHAHAYPFDEHASTFIVECPEPTWRRARLDEMSEEESLAFCERLFEADLEGRGLLSNRSLWLDFPRVTNRTWHHGNVVLLGDAAHTAHFSIGSGTKLAMEDSIALTQALVRRGWDVEAALIDYELERQPTVERIQAAASDSAAYFARVERYTHLEPPQFAFNLLTRSGRITHSRLTVRDPTFMRELDSWFAGSEVLVAPPPVFAPLRFGEREIPNRIVVEAGLESLPIAARSGAGLVLSELIAVSTEGRTTPECPMLDEATESTAAAIVEGVHEAGALVALRIGHAGRRGATHPSSVGTDVPLREGWPLVSASPRAYGPFGGVPTELDEEGMAGVREDFVHAADRARAIGADVLELDFSHGYLLASFLSPLSNRRGDANGGSPERRLRFPLDVFSAVRALWPGLLALRLSITDWAPRGLTVDDGIEIARAFVERGCDLVHPVAGQTIAADRPEYRRGFLTALSDRVRTELQIPTLVGGHLTTPDDANTIVAAGRGDLCILDLPPTALEHSIEPLSNTVLLGRTRR